MSKTKNKPHKGLLKRVRITKSGKIKLQKAYGRHLRSHKSAKATRRFRLPTYACPADAKRLRGMLCLAGTGKGKKTTAEASKQTTDKDQD
jgi:large subunit ribosomal protein L35